MRTKINKLVSVVIPYYNSSSTIIETVKSVLNQGYPNIEIIIVNDGSNEPLPTYIKKLKIVQIVQQQNKGQTKARIEGIKNAKGYYYVFLDSDDIIKPTYIEKCVKEIEKSSDIKIVYTKAKYFGDVNKVWKLKPFQKERFLFENCIYISALHRASDYTNCGGLDPDLTYFEDWDLWISILKNGGKVVRLNENLFRYRIENTKLSVLKQGNLDSKIKDSNMSKIYSKHQEYYSENGYNFYNIINNNIYKYKYKNQWFKKLLKK